MYKITEQVSQAMSEFRTGQIISHVNKCTRKKVAIHHRLSGLSSPPTGSKANMWEMSTTPTPHWSMIPFYNVQCLEWQRQIWPDGRGWDPTRLTSLAAEAFSKVN